MSIDLWFLEDVRDAVNSPETAEPDLVREASIAYNEACRATNVRLREVDKLLRHGLRSEAIQLAEQEPPLLELVADLDFPLLEEWQGMLAQWGMQLPPQLELEITARLNSTYAELRPLERLIRQHRLLALARAPLSARIEVLRMISSQDDFNPSWKTDLQEYERLRLHQIRSEAAEAKSQRDTAKLTELYEELRNSPWICDVPGEILPELEASHRLLQSQYARESLESLVPHLHQAHSELNFSTASELVDRWHRHAEAASLDDSDPLAIHTREALEWVDQQRKAEAYQLAFQTALASIENALDKNRSASVLESLLQKVERFELPLPDRLRQQVVQRIDAERLHAKRRGQLIAFSATACLALMAVGAYFFWESERHSKTLEQHAASLSQLVDDNSWDQAQSYFDSVPESLRSEPRMQSLGVAIEKGIRRERERIDTFAKRLLQIETDGIASLDNQKLSQLKHLAKAPDEKKQVADLELRLRQYRAELQQERDGAFVATVSEWSEKLAQLEANPEIHEEDAWRMLTDMEAELAEHARISNELKHHSRTLANRLRAIITQLREEGQQKQLFRAVAHATGDPEAFQRALVSLERELPSSLIATHARQVLDESEAWQSVLQWANFWEGNQSAWNELNPQIAQDILSEAKELQESTLENDLSKEFSERKKHLEYITARPDPSEVLTPQIIDYVLLKNVWMVVDNEGKRFYTLNEPDKDDETRNLRFQYIEDFTGSEKTRAVSYNNLKWHGISPQTLCVKEFEIQLSGFSQTKWDQAFYNLASVVRKATQNDPPLDPVLAVDLLRRILDVGCQGSLRFSQAFSDVIETIDEAGIDLTVKWHLPQDSAADDARRSAREVLDNLSPFDELIKQTHEFYQSKCLPPANYKWVAILSKNGEGEWECTPPLSAEVEGSLFICTRLSDAAVTLIPIGVAEEGNVSWMLPSDVSHPIFSPIFLRNNTRDVSSRQ